MRVLICWGVGGVQWVEWAHNVFFNFYYTGRSLGIPHIRHATLLHVLLDFHTYIMLLCCTFSWTSTTCASCYPAALFSSTSTHTSCYSAVHSLGLPHIRHATLLYVFLDFHTYDFYYMCVMLRCCMFSSTSTHTSCYSAVHSLGLPHIQHATLLYVFLDFHTYVMLLCCTFSWTSFTDLENFVLEAKIKGPDNPTCYQLL